MFGFLKKTKSAPKPPALPPLTAAQLRPRIKHVDYIRTLREAGVPPDQIPDHVPLCGDLLVTYAFDLPDTFIMATSKLLHSAGIAREDAPRLARENLGGTLPSISFQAHGGCEMAVTGGELEASLLVLDGLWKAVQADISGELLVTVPRRNRLLMCDSAHGHAVDALRAQTLKFSREFQDQYCLSNQIMVRRDDAWSLFEAH